MASADGVFGSEWLAEHLQGVRILLLASCTFHPPSDSLGSALGSWLGESLGDCLGRAPYVVAIGNEIMPADAALLARHFWHNIGLAQDPAEALATALQHCPPNGAARVHRSR